ncbi:MULTISPECIES: hypothetical protein [Burkholderia]|uniref:hypothetical protein n=1 Tax=Burkholderia TaxID=32008 RepID=UPI00163FE3B3|nr:hypothetical protein [Burkholderia gladioli]
MTIEQLLEDTDCRELDLIHIAYEALGEENYRAFEIYSPIYGIVVFEVFLENGIMIFKHNNQPVFEADY